ncbi:trehalose-phosphatase [Herbaspirillum sp. GCM10030257]|uniref:trehalose-phosphatase n=1 Tax=Herbaspirillum sp. GCM10030257 TaxID=3273393 RepID=UPI00361DB8E0
MAFPFFDKGVQHLLDLVRPGMLCAFDFDGTLAPIVADPSEARIPAPILRRLAALTEFTPVAVITGRSVEDVSLRLDFFPEYVIGNHGIEGMPGQETQEEFYRLTCQNWLERLQAALQTQVVDSAVWIEDKTFSLSIHYRMAQDLSRTETQLRQLIRQQIPDAKVVDGKCVFNVLPNGAPCKGDALVMLRNTISAPSAIYLGDDVTDESVFRLSREEFLTIRIENAPDTAAQYYLQRQEQVIELLDILLHRLSAILLDRAGSRSVS